MADQEYFPGRDVPVTPDEKLEIPDPFERLVLSVSLQDSIAVVFAEGDLDPHTTPYIDDTVQQLLDNPEVDRVAVEASNVNFVDSIGLRFMADKYRGSSKNGKGFEIHNPNRGLKKLLLVTGLADHIPIIETEEDKPD